MHLAADPSLQTGIIVNPITQQPEIVLQNNLDQSGSYYIRKSRWKQAKPYNLPLPYRYERRDTIHAAKRGPYNDFSNNYAPLHYNNVANAAVGRSGRYVECFAYHGFYEDPHLQAVLSVARARFVKKTHDTASWAVTFAERRQAIDMMTKRLVQLGRFAKAVRRLDIVGAAYELGYRRPRERYAVAERVKRALRDKRNQKTPANLWLEFWFGWSPLVSDVFSTVDILQKPFNDLPVIGRASNKRATAVYRELIYADWAGDIRRTATHELDYRCKVGGKIRVTNPNLFLASQLGLTNPATVALELIPFSWVANWFVNLSEFIGQFSDFHGVDVIDAYHLVRMKDSATGAMYHVQYHDRANDSYSSFISSAIYAERRLGVPDVKLGIRPPWRLSLTRAASAISVLVQRLIK